MAAFRRGDYQEATRLAAHALIDMPRQARVHELMSLALFALGNYPAAAMEAHAAVVLGPVADWPTLYSYYENLPRYTTQLDALAKYAHAHPSLMSGWFLLAYQNLMMGHTQAAQDLLAKVVAKEPQDKVAAALLKQLEDHAGKVGGIASRAPQPKR
jgi:tetratricopeptide (TPR) repeat protein